MEVSPDALAQVADYFKVLSEVSRLQVLCCLKSGSKSVNDIVAATELGQANVSKHLKILTQAGILSGKPSGVSVYYEIADPIIFELCELACDRLSISLEVRSQQINQLETWRKS